MSAKEIATIRFIDAESKGEAVAIVRALDDCITLCLSLQSNGDVEVVMTAEDTKRLLDALQVAISGSKF